MGNVETKYGTEDTPVATADTPVATEEATVAAEGTFIIQTNLNHSLIAPEEFLGQTSTGSVTIQEQPQEDEEEESQQIELLKHKAIPRCSSFLAIPAPSGLPPWDGHYAVWYTSFVNPSGTTDRERALDITEALAGQRTPYGFPLFTNIEEFAPSRKTKDKRNRIKLNGSNAAAASKAEKPKEDEKPTTSKNTSIDEAARAEQLHLALDTAFSGDRHVDGYYSDQLPYWNMRI